MNNFIPFSFHFPRNVSQMSRVTRIRAAKLSWVRIIIIYLSFIYLSFTMRGEFRVFTVSGAQDTTNPRVLFGAGILARVAMFDGR